MRAHARRWNGDDRRAPARGRRPVVRPLRRAGAVVFDCDSTLTAIEGIESLAGEHRAEVERLTEAAMRGTVPLEVVYGRRLELVCPSRADVEAVGERYVAELVPDAREVVDALRDEGITIRILSGGLRPAVVWLARELGVADGDVAAVDVRFDADGAWAGHDAGSPLARACGKPEVLRAWRAELPAPIVLVGDGATDLEAAVTVDTFIAYAGVIAREAVAAGADAVIRSRSLAPVLPLALAGAPPRDPAHRALWQRGLDLLDDDTRNRLTLKSDGDP